MPLPPALAARLAKRGIISKEQANKDKDKEEHRNSSNSKGQEEVFAENYDGDDDTSKSKRHKGGHRGGAEVEDKIRFMVSWVQCSLSKMLVYS